MARHAHTEEQVPWRIDIPKHLSDAVEEVLYDPIRKRPRYGARRRLIITLLRDYLDAQANGEPYGTD